MHEPEPEISSLLPFASIGLSFSGGGFRAAAYSLGVLSYLHRITIKHEGEEDSLLSHVHFIASASGGSITNLMYSQCLFQEPDVDTAYRKCFASLYTALKGESLLEQAIQLLGDTASWEPGKTHKQRNVINAFARVYDDALFNGETFDLFTNGPAGKNFSLCINATEFFRGISFRFQHESDTAIRELVGNRWIRFKADKKDVLGKIKLADILAASSCFPSGFEPIIFPDDFAYPGGAGKTSLPVDDLKNSVFVQGYNEISDTITDPIALMDGGITDNQALYSVMYADDRREKKHPFDFIMINDVTSYFMTPYKVEPEIKTAWGENTLMYYMKRFRSGFNWYRLLRIIISCILLLSIAGIAWLNRPDLAPLLYFVCGFSGLGAIIIAFIQYMLTKTPVIKAVLSKRREADIQDWATEKFKGQFSEPVITGLLAFLKVAKLSNLKQMVMARLNSVITMSVEVNLKQVRRLIYTIFYENPKWYNRRASNFIYELNDKNKKARTEKFSLPDKSQPTVYLTEADRQYLLDLGPQIPRIANEASAMGTTLWFGRTDTDKQMLDKIIQCGQFTTCVNLLEYTLTLIRQGDTGVLNIDKNTMSNLKELKDLLTVDWERFKEDPAFYIQQELTLST